MIYFSKMQVKKAKRILQAGGKRLLYYHKDADGVTSAALFAKIFSGIDFRPREGPVLSRDFLKEMEWEKPENLIFLDLPVDQSWKIIDRIVKKFPDVKIMIIDHHNIEKNLNSKNILHINPRFHDKNTYLPTAFLVHELFKELRIRVEQFCWITSIGIIGDYAFKECGDFLEKCSKNHPFLGRAEELVSGAITLKRATGAERVLELITESKTYREFMRKQQLRKWRDIVDKEFKKVVIKAGKGRESFPELKLLIYSLKSKLNLLSHLATHFSEKNPDHVILAVRELGEFTKVSFRCQSGRVNVADLAKKAAKKLGSAGGHPKAAGGMINNWELFKKRIIRELRK